METIKRMKKDYFVQLDDDLRMKVSTKNNNTYIKSFIDTGNTGIDNRKTLISMSFIWSDFMSYVQHMLILRNAIKIVTHCIQYQNRIVWFH